MKQKMDNTSVPLYALGWPSFTLGDFFSNQSGFLPPHHSIRYKRIPAKFQLDRMSGTRTTHTIPILWENK